MTVEAAQMWSELRISVRVVISMGRECWWDQIIQWSGFWSSNIWFEFSVVIVCHTTIYLCHTTFSSWSNNACRWFLIILLKIVGERIAAYILSIFMVINGWNGSTVWRELNQIPGNRRKGRKFVDFVPSGIEQPIQLLMTAALCWFFAWLHHFSFHLYAGVLLFVQIFGRRSYEFHQNLSTHALEVIDE